MQSALRTWSQGGSVDTGPAPVPSALPCLPWWPHPNPAALVHGGSTGEVPGALSVASGLSQPLADPAKPRPLHRHAQLWSSRLRPGQLRPQTGAGSRLARGISSTQMGRRKVPGQEPSLRGQEEPTPALPPCSGSLWEQRPALTPACWTSAAGSRPPVHMLHARVCVCVRARVRPRAV